MRPGVGRSQEGPPSPNSGRLWPGRRLWENFTQSEEDATQHEEQGSLPRGGRRSSDVVGYGSVEAGTPASGSW